MDLGLLFRTMGRLDGSLYLLSRALDVATAGHVRLVRYYFTVQPLSPDAQRPMRPDAATEIRLVRPGDPLCDLFPRPTEVIQRRYAAGADCSAALVRGEFAGFIWIQRDCYVEDEVRCVYEMGDSTHSVWDYDVYVEPRFRLGRTMARLWTHVSSRLASEGRRYSFSRISAFNPASMASHGRLGATRCGSATFLRAGRLQLSWLGGEAGFHISIRDAAAPRLTLWPPA